MFHRKTHVFRVMALAAAAATLGSARLVAAQSLLITSRLTNNVIRYNFNAATQTYLPAGAFVAAGAGGLAAPAGLRFGPDGNLYIASLGAGIPVTNSEIKRYNGTTGAFMNVYVPQGAAGLMAFPATVAFGPDGNLYVGTGVAASCVQQYAGPAGAAPGAFLGNFACVPGPGLSIAPVGLILSDPIGGLAVGPGPRLYSSWFSEVGPFSERVRAHTWPLGAAALVFTSTLMYGPSGMTIGPNGNLYIANFAASPDGGVLQFNTTTGAQVGAGLFAATPGGLPPGAYMPHDVIFAPNGNLLVLNQGQDTVLEYNGVTGAFIRTAVAAGAGGLMGGMYMTFMPDAPCPADLSGDGAVSGVDLAQLLAAWTGAALYAPCPPFRPADLNQDCSINGLDLASQLAAWGACP